MRKPGLTSAEVDTAADRAFEQGSVARRAFAETFGDLPPAIQADVELAASLDLLPAMLDVLGQLTGMGFVAMVRVTQAHWVACAVRDTIHFGLQSGGELPVATTLCSEVRDAALPIVIDSVAASPHWSTHACPATYGFDSYLSMPIVLCDGTFFGTVCAIDKRPAALVRSAALLAAGTFADAIGIYLHCHLQLERPGVEQSLRTLCLAPDQTAHDDLLEQLRVPLQVIQPELERLRHLPGESLGNEVEQMALLAPLARSVAALSNQCANLFDLARLHGGQPLLLDVADREPLHELLKRAADRIRIAHPERCVTLDIAPVGSGAHDANRLAQALCSLLLCALRSADDRASISVTGRQDAEPAAYRLSVACTGTALSSARIDALFEPDWRAAHDPDAQRPLLADGLGSGLYVARQIAEAHEGRVTVARRQAGLRSELQVPTRSRTPAALAPDLCPSVNTA